MEVHWWPVGQGLFMSGRLFGAASGQFTWVYDCGSTSGAAERDKAIAAFRKELAGRRIDLVTLSHFDSDHINGIVALIRGVRVRTLLLPYVPLWQRLLIALGEEIGADEALLAFYLDPAGYLASIEGSEIDEIVFVPGAGPDDVVPGFEDEPDPDRPIEGGKAEYGPPSEGSDGDPAVAGSANVQVRFLKPAGRIIVPSLWEFIPLQRCRDAAARHRLIHQTGKADRRSPSCRTPTAIGDAAAAEADLPADVRLRVRASEPHLAVSVCRSDRNTRPVRSGGSDRSISDESQPGQSGAARYRRWLPRHPRPAGGIAAFLWAERTAGSSGASPSDAPWSPPQLAIGTRRCSQAGCQYLLVRPWPHPRASSSRGTARFLALVPGPRGQGDRV
jgi:hypothetical protein